VLELDPLKQMEFERAVMANDTQLQQAYLADVQNARARDAGLAKAGRKNTRANLMAAPAVTLVVMCLLIVVWNSGAAEWVKATISLILGRALGWVEQFFSFEFGTTRNSRTKDDTINNLTKS
jgi:hypothetical protein